MYFTRWEELPEVEVLPNNYRRAISGLEVSTRLERRATSMTTQRRP
jgi:hypothetical protein